MSRYPGTQFKVYDNSQAAATVPVASGNSADAVSYMSAFRSVKGPEKITSSYGQEFYDLYGTQDNVNFKKYGQPLFQTSMNINNGARIIGKRAVLDDATLGNTTVAIRVTKYKSAKIILDENDKAVIANIAEDTDATKYSIAPLMFSVNNLDSYQLANTTDIDEYKERYDLYKNYIYNVVANTSSANATFLNQLTGEDAVQVPSGFAISTYYDENGKIVTDTDSKKDVRTVSSICVGTVETPKTISTSYNVDDFVGDFDPTEKIQPVNSTTTIGSGSSTGKDYKNYKILNVYKYTYAETGTDTGKYKWSVETSEKVKYSDIDSTVAIDQLVNKYDADLIAFGEKGGTTAKEYKAYDEGLINKHNEVFVFEYEEVHGSTKEIDIDAFDITEGYTSAAKLRNDLMMTIAYLNGTMVEYVFPMFTIFDNGRGESTKTISLEFDPNTSKTLKKAVYKLCVYNYKTSKLLESYYFTLNPYEINPSTGYSFDIESAVNNVSEQISVKAYYDSFDALTEVIQNITGTYTETVVSDNDTLFGHLLTGSFPTYSSYEIGGLKAFAYVYDYANLNTFSNENIVVNAFCNIDNMTDADETTIKYYYYNYLRIKQKTYEKLEFGSYGYCLTRALRTAATATKKFYYIVEDDSVVEETGLIKSTIVDDADLEPLVPSNFAAYTYGTETKPAYELKYNDGSSSLQTIYINDSTYTAIVKIDGIRYTNADETTVKTTQGTYYIDPTKVTTELTIYIPYSEDKVYEEQYRRFFNGEFDRDIFNLDVYFPNAIFDANYANKTKLAIQRLVSYRGDLMAYMDMGIGKVNSYQDCADIIPTTDNGLDLVETTEGKYYVRDMHIAVTCLSYSMRNPYDNKVITVTGTYALSNLYINHFARSVSGVFAGISNGITISGIIDGTANYIPKIYPTDQMTSLSNIGGVYPSDDDTIMNEKQLMCDLRVNYGSYYEDKFCIDTEYTLHPEESEFSYWNNVALTCAMMQAVRKACPAARYQFITQDDLNVYETAVNTALTPWKSKFAKLTFTYVQDENALQNKIFYAAIEVTFKPFAQAEIFTITALNYSTLDSSVTSI